GGQARDILAAGPFDLLVSDQLAIGSGLAAERSGTPWASVGISPLALPSRDVPPIGFALLPARGPAGRLRDAVLRRMSQLLLGRRLDAVTAEVRASLTCRRGGPAPSSRSTRHSWCWPTGCRSWSTRAATCPRRCT